MIVLLQIFSWFGQSKSFENRLIFGKVKAYKNGVPICLRHPVCTAYCAYSSHNTVNTIFAIRAGASLLGRWLLPRVRQHSALSVVSWRSDLCGAANIQHWRRQNILQPRDLACGTLFRSSCAIQTSPTDCWDDSWRDAVSGTTNTALRNSDMRRHRKTLTYLIRPILSRWVKLKWVGGRGTSPKLEDGLLVFPWKMATEPTCNTSFLSRSHKLLNWIFATASAAADALGRVSVCLSLCSVRVLTCENIDLESLFFSGTQAHHQNVKVNFVYQGHLCGQGQTKNFDRVCISWILSLSGYS